MNPPADQLGFSVGANGLPYAIPIHPNLVHLTLGLFIIAIVFDIAGVLFPIEKPLIKIFGFAANRSNFFDVGWYNLLGSAIITFFTVSAGFFEIMLAQPPLDLKSSWGLTAYQTMLWHGVGGVVLLFAIVGLTLWRGLQRYRWRKDQSRQVQWSYLAAGVAVIAVLYFHGTLGAQMAAEFAIHNTAGNLLRQGVPLRSIK
ncbi:DUF2231 domain-containing protein [Gloeobacter kilaueensis]|uniref:DUF2231 domain-containing protein n=1 Tax=Gloeobacter kilaueensis (strain ATCC BAA-2537 / CCAP 1431/1 / ULC 316 / JS1) TaxID=1183438 RepID=U5QNM6_GLOK1|nr:DUF2231 domain-containing protein [Gloeobacter kilaueensis]AGY59275.1 hypothetical protein GKIL_3029 [Gloeobacter kilaueensis JS1]